MTRSIIPFAGLVLAAVSSFASAQIRQFRAWFEAPQTVMAGETFQVWMWATYEINGVPETFGHMDSAAGSIEVSGDLDVLASISQLRQGLYFILERGTPDGPWLRDFATVQPYGIPGVIFDERNPLPILMFEIETIPGTTGLLQVDLRPYTDYSTAILHWYDPRLGLENSPNTLDPGISLLTSSATIRVIPTPASAALLCLATLMPARRRRESRHRRQQ